MSTAPHLGKRELTLVVLVQESWRANQLIYYPGPGPNICPIYNLLKGASSTDPKLLDLHGTGQYRIYKRSPTEDPVLKVWQKSEASNQTNDSFASETVWDILCDKQTHKLP